MAVSVRASATTPDLQTSSKIGTSWRVKSASRTMDIIEYFNRERRPVRVIEIGQSLGMPQSSACEILKTLVDSGHLSFDERKKTYFPSYRLALIASWLGEVYGNDRLYQVMDALGDESGEAVALTAQCGSSMQIMAMRNGPDGACNDLIEGSRVPIIASISGAGLLMTKTHHETRRIVARCTHLRGNKRGGFVADSILSSISRYRVAGYAFFQERPLFGSLSLAVPLPRSIAPVQLVLGCGGHPSRIQHRAEQIGKTMRTVISRYL